MPIESTKVPEQIYVRLGKCMATNVDIDDLDLLQGVFAKMVGPGRWVWPTWIDRLFAASWRTYFDTDPGTFRNVALSMNTSTTAKGQRCAG